MDIESSVFRWMVEASTDGLWLLDEQGSTLYANARMAELLGIDSDRTVGFSAFEALDEEGRAQLPQHLAMMASGHPGEENLELMLVRTDGHATWSLVSWCPITDDSGRGLGWLHRVTEYTQRKTLVETLRVREQQLATAQRIAQIGSWEWDVPTDTVTWSDQLYRIYNLQPQEYAPTYQGFLDFMHPEDRPRVEAAVGSAFAGAAEFGFAARIIRHGGEQRWIRGLGVVDRDADGSPRTMGGTAQDITDLVRADELTAEANRRVRLLQQMTMAANRATSLEEAVHTAAVGLPDHTGWAPVCAYLVAADGTLTPMAFPAEPGAWAPDPALAERARDAAEVAVDHRGAHTLVAVPVQVRGRVVCVIEVAADEVPLDEGSVALVEQIAGQLSVVAERERTAVELAEAVEAATEASRLKSEFLATMSHEIRTPMNGVIGLNDLLLRTDLDPRQRRLAEGLQGAGLTLLGIINDILDLSKIEAGRLELEDADFDVRAVFAQAADLLGGPARDQGIELVLSCHPAVPFYLRGDSVRFGQVITNLGSNAVKFTDHGEVSVQARVESEDADVVVLRVDVADTGVGIAPEAREQLFDLFTQADPSTTRRHGGTGLGLAISRRLVHALGGEIEMATEVGRGSTFSFTARFGRATTAPARRRSGLAPDLLHGRRVLVVDDNATNRFVLDEQLTAWRMASVSVDTADAALAALSDALERGEPFEIALLDLYLRDGDGIELAHRIRSDSRFDPLRMMLLSSGEFLPARAREAGIREILDKPVRHDELYDGLVRIIGVGVTASGDDLSPPAPQLERTVLVVEDNQVNQMVAAGLLESLGYAVDIAPDGIEAVELLSLPHEYAAVLMDCRMPRLDGYDATRRVRQRERDGHRVPIIAMTASVLEGERERCLAAGMDDFLTKPVVADQLEVMLNRWTSGAGARAPGASIPRGPEPEGPAPEGPAADGDASADPEAVVDLVRKRMLDELRRDGVSFFDRTARSFISRVDEQLVEIRTASESADVPGLVSSAHRLTGSALNLGLPRVGAAARALERLGDEGRVTGAERLIAELEREIARAVSALRQMLYGEPD